MVAIDGSYWTDFDNEILPYLHVYSHATNRWSQKSASLQTDTQLQYYANHWTYLLPSSWGIFALCEIRPGTSYNDFPSYCHCC